MCAVCCLLRLIKNVPHVNGNFVNFYLFISSATANSPWPTAPVPSTLPTLYLCSSPGMPLFHSPFYRYCPFFVVLVLSLPCAKCFMCSAGNVPSAVINTNIFIHLCVRVCVCSFVSVCCAIWLLMCHTIEAFANCKLKTVDMTKGCQEAKSLCKLIQFDSCVRPQMSLAGKWKTLSLLPFTVWWCGGGRGVAWHFIHKQLNFHTLKRNVLIVAFTTLLQGARCCAFDFNKKKFPKQIF